MAETFFSRLIETIRSVASKIGRVSTYQIVLSVIMNLPAIVQDFKDFKGASKAERIGNACEELDNLTGMEEGAFDIVKDMPPEIEEKLFDSLKNLIEILGLYAIGDSSVRSSKVLAGKKGAEADDKLVGGVMKQIAIATGREAVSDLVKEGEELPDSAYHAHLIALESIDQDPSRVTVADQLKNVRRSVIYLYRSHPELS